MKFTIKEVEETKLFLYLWMIRPLGVSFALLFIATRANCFFAGKYWLLVINVLLAGSMSACLVGLGLIAYFIYQVDHVDPFEFFRWPPPQPPRGELLPVECEAPGEETPAGACCIHTIFNFASPSLRILPFQYLLAQYHWGL